MGLLRTIAIIIIVYYIFKFFSRYIAPIFLRKVVEKAEQKFREQQQDQQNQGPEGKVGDTVISQKPPLKKESNKDVGDYVDYEELQD